MHIFLVKIVLVWITFSSSDKSNTSKDFEIAIHIILV